MSDLQTVLDAIDRLPPDELEQVQQRLEQRRASQKHVSEEDIDERIGALHKAVENFWEGFTDEEVDEIVAAMNSEYIEPEDPTLFAWVEELPEDER